MNFFIRACRTLRDAEREGNVVLAFRFNQRIPVFYSPFTALGVAVSLSRKCGRLFIPQYLELADLAGTVAGLWGDPSLVAEAVAEVMQFWRRREGYLRVPYFVALLAGGSSGDFCEAVREVLGISCIEADERALNKHIPA